MKTKKLLTAFFCCVLAVHTTAQSLRHTLSMPYTGLAAYSRTQHDVFSFSGNQAALASLRNSGVGIYTERRFMLAENSVYAFAAALHSAIGNVGLKIDYAGFRNFNENRVGLAYGRSLGSKIDIGVQFNYYGYRIPGYGNASAINFEGGMILHLTDKLSTGIHLYNPVAGKLGKGTDEKLASCYKLGAGYDASESFYVNAELVKEEDKPVNITGGFQYCFRKQFFLRAGFQSEISGGFAAVGVSWKYFRLDVSAAYHPQLGISPGLLLMANFKKKNHE